MSESPVRVVSFDAFRFEGKRSPHPEELAQLLRDNLRAGDGHWLRAAILHAPFAAAQIEIARGWLTGETEEIYCSTLIIEALAARTLLEPLCERLMCEEKWRSTPCPSWGPIRKGDAQPASSIAEAALRVILALSEQESERVWRLQCWGWNYPSLRPALWLSWPMSRPPEQPLQWLAELLAARPDLLPLSGDRFALLYRPWCLSAAERLKVLPRPLRERFYAHLAKHLDRVGAIKLKVSCRRALALHRRADGEREGEA